MSSDTIVGGGVQALQGVAGGVQGVASGVQGVSGGVQGVAGRRFALDVADSSLC